MILRKVRSRFVSRASTGGLHQKFCTRASDSPNPTFGRRPCSGNPRTSFSGSHPLNFLEVLVGAIGFLSPRVNPGQVQFRHNSEGIFQVTLEVGRYPTSGLFPWLGTGLLVQTSVLVFTRICNLQNLTLIIYYFTTI